MPQTAALLTLADTKLLIQIAEEILGSSDVATVTTETLTRMRIDKERLGRLLRANESPVLDVAQFEIKRIDAEPNEPDKFGVFVRRMKVAR